MKISYGVDYYPEHWPEERWDTDAALMRDARMDVVRMAEFAWNRLEPEPGVYQWDWLDRAIRCLAAYGIKTVLGTPTATPPIWLVRRYPDIRGADLSGTPWYEGTRRHACPTSPTYRRESSRIVQAMAEHYGDNPHVIGWQIDNELGCHVAGCGCLHCERGFRDWVRQRYTTLEAVNQAWGTVVWSNEFREWDDIPLPRPAPALHNPSLVLAYRRFMSDSFIGFQRTQVEILRERCPQHFITHNMMGLFSGIDYYGLAADLDVVSWDNYPGFFSEGQSGRTSSTGLAADVMRGVGDQKPFWVMEQQAGPTTWDFIGRTPAPGQLRLWAYQTVAHGADAIVYFRWRTNRVGPEQFWHGLLDHSGVPGRRYREAAQVGTELKELGDIAGSRVPAETAIVRDYDVIWAFEIQRQSPAFSYGEQIQSFHDALSSRHVPAHVVSSGADLSSYRLVILASQYLLHPGQAERLKQYVHDGGHLIVTARTGVKDEDNVVTELPLPGELADLCGVVVDEYDALSGESGAALVWDEDVFPIHGWADILEPRGAEVLATYNSGYYAGHPALTSHRYGAGRVWYLGTLGDEALYARLVDEARRAAAVSSLLPEAVPLEVIRRQGPQRSYTFMLNHTSEPVHITGGICGREMLTNHEVEGTLTVPALDLAIIRERFSSSVTEEITGQDAS